MKTRATARFELGRESCKRDEMSNDDVPVRRIVSEDASALLAP